MAHLRRLLAERLARTALAASAHTLRLRSLETVPWAGESTSLLPEDRVQGEPLHAFIERVSERLGEHQVLVAERGLDHRPERMQRWVPARRRLGPARRPGADDAAWADALFPTWLLPEPVPLEVIDERPHHGGPLRLLTRAWRVRTAWWEGTAIATATATANATPTRDYFVARSPTAGLLWVFRERVPAGAAPGARAQRWFLHGLYG
jgi:protein ImuB